MDTVWLQRDIESDENEREREKEDFEQRRVETRHVRNLTLAKHALMCSANTFDSYTQLECKKLTTSFSLARKWQNPIHFVIREKKTLNFVCYPNEILISIYG